MCKGRSLPHILGLVILLGASVARAEIPVVNEAVLSGWGFQATQRVSYPESFCEEEPLPEKALYQGVRSAKPHPDREDSYWRFTLAMEAYASDKQAMQRLHSIHHPENRNSKQRKLCDMRKGFRDGNRIYFVHTNVSAYAAQLPALLEKLRAIVADPFSYAISNPLEECVAIQEKERQKAGEKMTGIVLQLMLEKEIGHCGCKSAIAALHWEHGDQLLDARYFPLRESRTLLFDVPESAPAGLRLYLGCG